MLKEELKKNLQIKSIQKCYKLKEHMNQLLKDQKNFHMLFNWINHQVKNNLIKKWNKK